MCGSFTFGSRNVKLRSVSYMTALSSDDLLQMIMHAVDQAVDSVDGNRLPFYRMRRYSPNCLKFCRREGRVRTSRQRISHTCSIWLRSGLGAGQWMDRIPWVTSATTWGKKREHDKPTRPQSSLMEKEEEEELHDPVRWIGAWRNT